jgi:hypothetical protein
LNPRPRWPRHNESSTLVVRISVLKSISRNIPALARQLTVRHWIAMAIFAVALAVRSLLLYLSLQQIPAQSLFTASSDVTNYVAGGLSLLHSGADHERVFFSFGPGYPSWLAIAMWLFGDKSMAIIYLQLLMSSLSCVLVYLLALKLKLSRAIAILAALLGAISVTSACLSCLPLSDTLFHLLFLAALWLFVSAIDDGHWWQFITAGLLFGCSVLVRSIGQFWFVPLILMAMLLARKREQFPVAPMPRYHSPRAKIIASILLILLVQAAWMARNYAVHGIWTIAYTSSGGPATVAAISLHPKDEGNYRQTLSQWEQEYLKEHNQTTFIPEEHYRMFQHHAIETFKNCPLCVFRAYMGLVWTNLNDIDYLHRILLPQSNLRTIKVEYLFKDHYLNYLGFPLALLGLLLLGIRRCYRAVIVLAAVYGYFMSMIGAFPWQGSRYFYPGYIAGDILISVVVVGLSSLLFIGAKRIFRRRPIGRS